VFAKDKHLGAEFALAFDEYAKDVPPNAQVAGELNVQLDVMEKFVTTLIDAHISSLDSLDRTKLPGEKAAKGSAAPPPAPAPPPAGTRPGFAVPAGPQQVLDRYTIKAVFTCDQAPLQRLMNALSDPSQTPDFLAVRLMRVENTRQEAPTKEEIKAAISSAASATPDAPRPPDAPPGEAGKPAARTARLAVPAKEDATDVLGAEALKVYLELDYIRFRQPQNDEAAGTAR
jgi:hypothetical protein